jgi:PAS domain-containing protein
MASHVDTSTDAFNWSTEFKPDIADGIRDLLLVLAVDGRILYASQMSFPLIGKYPEQLVGRYVSTYMNFDDMPVFLSDFKENMARGSSWRYHHRLRRSDDVFVPFESTFKPYANDMVAKQAGLEDTKMCLMTSRPYPNQCASLMDSFLEHCITNARLSDQLEHLKNEARSETQSTILAAEMER